MPDAMPCALVVISRTRQRVRNSTRARSACGQYVMSTLPLAPCAHPGVQWPRLMHLARPLYSVVAIEMSDGHQCQPSWFIACAKRVPDFPSGTGGMVGSVGGAGGDP